MTVKVLGFVPLDRVDPPIPGAVPRWARVLLQRANRLTPGGLSAEDLLAIWERSEGRCAISDLPFSFEVIGTGKAKRPFAPSLDRIDRLGGYEPRNVRLVCAIANFAMNAWGPEPLIALAKAIAWKVAEEEKNIERAARAWYKEQDARIAALEQELQGLQGGARQLAKRRLAGLKRARTLGPAGLKAAALKAAAVRQGLVPPEAAAEPPARRPRLGQTSLFE